MSKQKLTEAFNVKSKTPQLKDMRDYDIFPDKKLLERSLTRIKKNVTRNLNKLDIEFETNEYKIDQMKEAIEYNKRLIQKVTDEKNSIKIHFFTRKKKEKRIRIEDLEKFLEVLNNTEKEFIFIMNEYDKLTNRKKLDRRLYLPIICYLLIPVVGMLLQIMFYGIMQKKQYTPKYL